MSGMQLVELLRDEQAEAELVLADSFASSEAPAAARRRTAVDIQGRDHERGAEEAEEEEEEAG
jgi:hypothetical protein